MDKQKFDYLDEHLPYMLGTLRYNFDKIGKPQFFRDLNAYLESFAVNARNLVQFLTNADTGNFKASDFIKDFRLRKGDIQGPMKKLDEQVFHLGKSRPRKPSGKFDVSHASKVIDWIEEGMKDFLKTLPSEYDIAWNANKADPKFDAPHSLSIGCTGSEQPSASSSMLTSTTTTSSVGEYHLVGLSEHKIPPDDMVDG